MSFEEFFKKRHLKTGIYEDSHCGDDDTLYLKHEMSKSYKAGASSRQGEVDELKQALNSALQATKNVCVERDELQKLIDRLSFMLERGLGEDDFKS
jgi:hypothetical protein